MKKSVLPKSKAKTAYALLSQIRRLILAEPKRYNQTRFIARSRAKPGIDDADPTAPRGFPACGTVGCVAGWVATLKGPRRFGYAFTEGIAMGILGLSTFDQSNELFAGNALAGLTTANPQTKKYARAGAKHIAAFQKKYRTQLLAKKV